jgi:hypothetical protein
MLMKKAKAAREAYVDRWFEGKTDTEKGSMLSVPPSYRYAYAKALEGELKGKELVKIKCLQCMGWSRESVSSCQRSFCPFWASRPFQKKEVAV